MANIDLNQLAKKTEYTATISDVAGKEAAVDRHIRMVTFYALLVITVGTIVLCAAVFLGLIPATAEKQAWARQVLQTLFPAAAAYALGRQGAASSL